ncbi:MAG: imidazolonepropionase [Anaerolineaceae bacterium]|nr:imidazolonepropionase [Anaerolineaceae bacterium]
MLIIHNTSQLIALTPKAQSGKILGTLNPLPNGAVAIDGEKIVELGNSWQLLDKYPQADRFDAEGKALLPGFVDPHTHLIWAGDRAAEFEMRLEGKSYMEIMAAGGGIASTVKATRAASVDELMDQARERAMACFCLGSTTIEAKTGYGLDIDTEIRQLEVILKLNEEGPFELVPTFMGAHAIPQEYNGDIHAYTEFLTDRALPAVHHWWLLNAKGQPLPFVDVFCESGVFDIEHTQQILASAHALGFPLKLHADEFANIGGASLAAKMGASSADHLVKTSLDDIRALAYTDTVAVSLPGTPFGLGQTEYTPATAILEADGFLALATDLNPGTTWNESMQMIQAIACRYLKLTPAQALAASTINSAKAIWREDKVGSICPGKQADMILLRSPDYRNLSYRYGSNQVAAVIKKGRVYPQLP